MSLKLTVLSSLKRISDNELLGIQELVIKEVERRKKNDDDNKLK